MKNTPAKVLIVDDDKVSLYKMRLAVESLGYQVIIAPNGSAALKMVQEETPDIIILDLIMPEMDGYEVCRRVKAAPNFSNIPIIFLSGLNSPKDKLKAFEAGGVDYLIKPCSKTGLFVRLRTHLNLQDTQNHLVTEVKKRSKELEEKNNELHELNIVLKRLLHEIEKEKHDIGRIIRLNIEHLILPDLDRMTKVRIEKRCQLRDTIRTNLLDLTRPLAGENTNVYSCLAPSELGC
ncbi:MAG: response regulator [Candidatus Electrothrix sp. AR4]|nr:response regulator [Candidatus Electrothrix sp. AR4]